MRDQNGDPVHPEDVLDSEELAEYYNSRAVNAGKPKPFPSAAGEREKR